MPYNCATCRANRLAANQRALRHVSLDLALPRFHAKPSSRGGNGEGPKAALDILNELETSGQLTGYHLLAATQADCLRRLARYAEAAVYDRQALLTVGIDAERRFLTRRLAEVSTHL